MDILQYIQNDTTLFSTKDRIEKIIHYFKNHTYTHLVIVEEGLLKGLLSEIDIPALELGKKIIDYEHLYQKFSVTTEMNWLEVLQKFGRYESNIMPVLSEDNIFLGYYELTSIMNFFGGIPFLTEPGEILVLEKNVKDYAMSELSQIVETENAKFLGAMISAIKNDNIQITIKINSQNYNNVLQSLRRYGYRIIHGVKDDKWIKKLKERSYYLNTYLKL